MSEAPERLEQVRTFLNTWEVPNDTRVPVDRLPELVRSPKGWAAALPGIPPAGTAELPRLRGLRNDLRRALGQERPVGLQSLVDGRWLVQLGTGADEPPLRLVPERVTASTALTAIVLTAVQEQTWHRLRACPDCGWAFYDSSRNARRQWCSMTAAGGARGCGSIAKTKAYRQRQRA